MALPLATNPPFVDMFDDSGTGLDGYVVGAAQMAEIAEAIDDAIYDPTNPTETPAAITAEVVAARDGEPTLKDRIDAVAALIVPPSPNFSTENLLINDDFSCWPTASTAGAPAGWTRSSTVGINAVTLSRSVTDLGAGPVSCLVTTGAIAGGPQQRLVPKGAGATIAVPNLFGRDFSALAKVKATAPGTVRIAISDGVNTYLSSLNVSSGVEETLVFTGQISSAAVFLQMEIRGVAATSFEVGPCTLGLTSIPLENWIPARKTVVETTLAIDGTTLNAECRFVMPALPSIFRRAVATGKTSSATLEIAIEKWHRSNGGLDPTNFRAVYAANIKSIGATAGGQPILETQSLTGLPDANYEDRCTGIATGNYDVIRARVAVADAAVVEMKVTFSYVTWSRLLENLIPNGF